jgi:hypothetical protein
MKFASKCFATTIVALVAFIAWGVSLGACSNTDVVRSESSDSSVVDAGGRDAAVVNSDAKEVPPTFGDASVPSFPSADASVILSDSGALIFAGGTLLSGAQLPPESATEPAFSCTAGTHQSCINMRAYWPTPAAGTMQVKLWQFASNDARALSGKGIYRSQGYFPVTVAGNTEYRLVDHFNGALWVQGLTPGGTPLESWIDTWSLRYDGDTVIEYKDDANYNTAVASPPIPGVAFVRSSYDPGHELRWGNRLVGGVDNASATYTWSDFYATASLTTLSFPRLRSYADNSFGLVEVRDGVVVNGIVYNHVAIVKVSQRSCVSGTNCSAIPSETSAWVIDYFYMAPSVGMIARFGYGPKTKTSGGFDLDLAGNFQFAPTYVELMTDLCTKPAPARTTYDWELAFADPTNLLHSPPAPSCP